MLVGTSGVGKSATVDHLLGVNIASTTKIQSETRSTKEFVVHGLDRKHAVEGMSVGLIDTPGFCDTDGPRQDACNLLSIQRFFRTHPTLSGSNPNLIFLLVKANDDRIVGKNSDLAKSLRCIKHLDLVDLKNPNVVVILTHVCSIRKKNDKKWTKALDNIKSTVKKIVFDNLKVLAPVVLIENMYENCRLKRRGDYTRLPNGELQPENLYLACADILLTNNDNRGLITLNTIFVEFKNGENRRITGGHVLEAKYAKKCNLDSEERAMVELLQLAIATKESKKVLSTYFLILIKCVISAPYQCRIEIERTNYLFLR